MELEVARQILLYHLRGKGGQGRLFPGPSQAGSPTDTYQGLFHGTVPLHHTAVLVNEELWGRLCQDPRPPWGWGEPAVPMHCPI